LRADYLLRAVPVPIGASTVMLRYLARYHVAGMNIRTAYLNTLCDAAMLATWIVAGVSLWRRRA
jgi:hypothetical protein